MRREEFPPLSEVRWSPLIRKAWNLTSTFQPILSLSHSQVVGHEALLRGHDRTERAITPGRVLTELRSTLTPDQAERLCMHLHLGSFAERGASGWLFINLSPAHIGDPIELVQYLAGSIEATGVAPHQVVCEITETSNLETSVLEKLARELRALGALVALDDFGAGESNFARVWQLEPDIVKLDRSMLHGQGRHAHARHILPGLVSLLHEAGCLVVLEGIETDEQALCAMESDVDFVQGYRFARPSPDLFDGSSLDRLFRSLARKAESRLHERTRNEDDGLSSYSGCFRQAARALGSGAELETVANTLLRIEGLDRVYLLDDHGIQIGPNLESRLMGTPDPRFEPCASAEGANWFRRSYFQRAISKPATLQVSRPYLSVRDKKRCTTLSMAVATPSGVRVLCADVAYQTPDTIVSTALRAVR